MPARALTLVAALAILLTIVGFSPAEARGAAHVRVDGTVSETSATRLTVTGSDFQSIDHGHGGVYVLFGTVKPGWRPSQGGAAGRDYYVVPDSQTRTNHGYEKYVAFPGSDTASSANGGQMNAAGDWSTTLVVPGPTFRALDRSGAVHTVDCRRVTCGVITIGAHGVVNDRNETFTPVRVTSAGSTSAPDPGSSTGSSTTQHSADTATSTDRGSSGRPHLVVDRRTAVAGRVLAFTAAGLPPRSQVSAVLDDGVAGTGPFIAGDDGRLSGVVTLPADLGPGTHQLRLYGVPKAPSARFAVAPADAVATEPVTLTAAEAAPDRAAVGFAAAAGVVLLLVVGRLVLVRRREARDAT